MPPHKGGYNYELLSEIFKIESALHTHIREEITRLLTSGAIDFDRDTQHGLPKILLHVALKNTASEYRPLTKEARAIARNLKHF